MGIWQILEIEQTADEQSIKTAYAKMVKKYHPEEFPEEFKQLQKSYKQALHYAKNAKKEASGNLNTYAFLEESFWIKEQEKKEQKALKMDTDLQSQKDSRFEMKLENESMSQDGFLQEERIGKKELSHDLVCIPKINYLKKENFVFLESKMTNPIFWAFEQYIHVYMRDTIARENKIHWVFLFEYKPFEPYITKEIYWYPLIENLIEFEVLDANIIALIHFYVGQMQMLEDFTDYLKKLLPEIPEANERFRTWRASVVIEEEFSYFMARDYVEKMAKSFETDGLEHRLYEMNTDTVQSKSKTKNGNSKDYHIVSNSKKRYTISGVRILILIFVLLMLFRMFLVIISI